MRSDDELGVHPRNLRYKDPLAKRSNKVTPKEMRSVVRSDAKFYPYTSAARSEECRRPRTDRTA